MRMLDFKLLRIFCDTLGIRPIIDGRIQILALSTAVINSGYSSDSVIDEFETSSMDTCGTQGHELEQCVSLALEKVSQQLEGRATLPNSSLPRTTVVDLEGPTVLHKESLTPPVDLLFLMENDARTTLG